MTRTPTLVPLGDGVRAVGRLYRYELEQLGFVTRWIDMPTAMNRAGHLLATRTGKQGKRVLRLKGFERLSPADYDTIARFAQDARSGNGDHAARRTRP